MKRKIKIWLFLLMGIIGVATITSCGGKSKDETSSYNYREETSLSPLIGDWTCSYNESGTRVFVKLTINSSGRGHFKMTVSQGYQERVILNENVSLDRKGDILYVSLNGQKDRFRIEGRYIITPGGEKLSRGY